MKNPQNHPMADLFPMMSDEEIKSIAEDIKNNGLRTPIYTIEGKILDGRNRLKACEIAGVKPSFKEFKGKDPLAFVLSANMHRRHLTESQRAMVAAEIANFTHGGHNKKQEITGSLAQEARIKIEEASKKLQVSPAQVKRAKRALRELSKAKVKKIKNGEVTISEALRAEMDEINREKEGRQKLDKTGFPIPRELIEDWNKAEDDAREILAHASRVKCMLESGKEREILHYREITADHVAKARSLYTSLKVMTPHAVCYGCNGKTRSNCVTCRKRGFVSEFFWDRCTPSEIKELRAKASKKS